MIGVGVPVVPCAKPSSVGSSPPRHPGASPSHLSLPSATAPQLLSSAPSPGRMAQDRGHGPSTIRPALCPPVVATAQGTRGSSSSRERAWAVWLGPVLSGQRTWPGTLWDADRGFTPICSCGLPSLPLPVHRPDPSISGAEEHLLPFPPFLGFKLKSVRI